VVEHLSSMYKTLGSIPTTSKPNQKLSAVCGQKLICSFESLLGRHLAVGAMEMTNKVLHLQCKQPSCSSWTCYPFWISKMDSRGLLSLEKLGSNYTRLFAGTRSL
jgi:hypothetical protein